MRANFKVYCMPALQLLKPMPTLLIYGHVYNITATFKVLETKYRDYHYFIVCMKPKLELQARQLPSQALVCMSSTLTPRAHHVPRCKPLPEAADALFEAREPRQCGRAGGFLSQRSVRGNRTHPIERQRSSWKGCASSLRRCPCQCSTGNPGLLKLRLCHNYHPLFGTCGTFGILSRCETEGIGR